MIRSLAITTCLATILMAGSALAATSATQKNWYIGADGGVTWLRDSDTGGGGNVSLGYRFNDWRVEAEAGYHGADNTHYFSYMGNIYYDFNSAIYHPTASWKVAPYLGAGLGDAAVHYGSSSFSTTFHHHSNEVAYQGMAGLNLTAASMPNTDWTLGYRYLGTDNHNLHSNNIEAGLRLHF